MHQYFFQLHGAAFDDIIRETMSETEFLSGSRQTISSRGRMVMFGFVIEVTSVKVKREERSRERIHLFEIKRKCEQDPSSGQLTGVTASHCASQRLVMVPSSYTK